MKKNLLWLIFLVVALIILVGCGDYYINVDKEAIKMEVDSLIDGFESEGKQ